MTNVVAELDQALQAMLVMKPPGVSGTRISAITNLCVSNAQSESVIVQKIYTHFKKTPGTHKLGVLYVVDSVTRQWVDHARKSGQSIGSAANDGTYAAGVNRVTELIPVLMNDIIQHAPADQKEKISKLVDIWDRGSTFPTHLLNSFKEKLNSPSTALSSTPPGTPPTGVSQNQAPQPASNGAPSNTSAILETLKNMAKQNASTPTPGASGNSNPVPSMGTQASSALNQLPAFSAAPQAANNQGAGAGSNLAAQIGMLTNAGQQASNPSGFPGAPQESQANPLAAIAAALPQGNMSSAVANLPGGLAGAGGNNNLFQNQIVLLQFLMQQGIPQEQWAPFLTSLNNNANAAPASGAQWPQNGAGQNSWGGRDDYASRDRDDGYESRVRSPPSRYRERSRSPVPAWRRDVDSPPRGGRRGSPVYGDYGNDGGDYDRRGRGGRYRQRSPAPRSLSPPRIPPNTEPKWVDYDPNIGQDNIKVLSRTLFVGGVTCPEDELRAIFTRFGQVQTCIVNGEKRHAFVKMISRHDALSAKEGMEFNKPPDVAAKVRTTRWGVGFGPRDCSDYQTGISIIPISKLTDADRKWMLSAEYGGSGGKGITGGMVVEEPDIEIGAGVSSKAISRRLGTEQLVKSGRGGRGNDSGGRTGGSGGRRDGGVEGDSSNTIGVPPAVPTFGFQFPQLPNGMPMFPPGFSFPGAPGTGAPPQRPPGTD